MKKNLRKMTYEESGVTLMPYKSLPIKTFKCKEHDYKLKSDAFGHMWFQCAKCEKSK